MTISLPRPVWAALLLSATAPMFSAEPENPLLTESTLPFQYPQFDRIKNEHFLPAFEAAMAENLREIGRAHV